MRRATMSVEAQLTSCVSHLMPPVHAIPWARERSRLDGDWLISRRDQQDQGHVALTPATRRGSSEVWRWPNGREPSPTPPPSPAPPDERDKTCFQAHGD